MTELKDRAAEITIREMRPEEAELVRKIGRPSFGLVERWLFQKPKTALLAIRDGKIVGAAAYRIWDVGDEQKVGYIETGVVLKDAKGEGVGTRLYRAVTEFLYKQGCRSVTANVRDDNVASWRLLEKYGYSILTLPRMREVYGFGGAARLWFSGMLCWATGYHLWSTVRTEEPAQGAQLCSYLLLNLFVLLPGLLFVASAAEFAARAAAALLLLLFPLGVGLAVTRCWKEPWRFRVARGGILVSLLVSALGGFFPIVGRFYPVTYNRSHEQTNQMGLGALAEWLTVLAVVCVAGFVLPDAGPFGRQLCVVGAELLLYRSIPFYPFSCFGGGRIWSCNRLLSALTAAVSIALILLL